MLNDIKAPPPLPGDDHPKAPAGGVNAPRLAQDTHTEPQEPGKHHARIFGEKTHLDLEYATPLEDRGSTFSISLTLAAAVVVVAVLVCVYVAIR